MTVQAAPGRHMLSQTVVIPPRVRSAVLSWSDRIRNHYTDFFDPVQEWRVRIRKPGGAMIQEVFSTDRDCDNCVFDANPDQNDFDEDGVGSACDTCPSIFNPQQRETVACIRIVKHGGQCLDARVDVVDIKAAKEIAIYDGEGALFSTTSFEGGQIPALIDIRSLPDGRATLCVRTGLSDQAECATFTHQGEEDLAINGAACGPPEADAGPDRDYECASRAGNSVRLDGSASSDVNSTPGTNDDIVLYEWFEDFGTSQETTLGDGAILETTFPLGEHQITLRVTDTFGESDVDSILLRVADTVAPRVDIMAEPATLWPPNHKMTQVSLRITVTDACDASPRVALVSVSSSEPDDAPGDEDGNTSDDIQAGPAGTPSNQILLRAERDESGPGRLYSITCSATDLTNNSGVARTDVLVPVNSK